MSNKSDNAAVALQSDKGNQTPISVNPFAVTDDAAQVIRETIRVAQGADKSAYTDITPLYWEAQRGDIKTMVFLGWKQTFRVNEKTGQEEENYMCVFHDGDRQIVAGQMALIGAMFGKQTGKVYRIECVESAKGSAKKFTVEQFNG